MLRTFRLQINLELVSVMIVGKMTEAEDFWTSAVKSLHGATKRAEITLQEVAAPNRLAPFALALTAELNFAEQELAGGKFVLLYDPDGQLAWGGELRVVTFMNAAIEPDVVTDQMFDEVAWSWLTESLAISSAEYTNLSGTITRTVSRSFAELSDRVQETNLEVRASWTAQSAHLAPQLTAWCSLLEQAAGLEPLPEGVTQLKRGQ